MSHRPTGGALDGLSRSRLERLARDFENAGQKFGLLKSVWADRAWPGPGQQGDPWGRYERGISSSPRRDGWRDVYGLVTVKRPDEPATGHRLPDRREWSFWFYERASEATDVYLGCAREAGTLLINSGIVWPVPAAIEAIRGVLKAEAPAVILPGVPREPEKLWVAALHWFAWSRTNEPGLVDHNIAVNGWLLPHDPAECAKLLGILGRVRRRQRKHVPKPGDRPDTLSVLHDVSATSFAAIHWMLNRPGQKLPSEAADWRDLVTLNQAAGMVHNSKRTLERYKKRGTLPAPEVKGGRGRADLYHWPTMRLWLESTFSILLPERPPANVNPLTDNHRQPPTTTRNRPPLV